MPVKQGCLLKQLIYAVALLLLFVDCYANILAGEVVWVVDGDTVHIKDRQDKLYKIRLSGINAPEKKRPYSAQAKRHLMSLIYGANVRVYWQKNDRYGRIVGKVIFAGKDINLAMIRAGYARWYRRFASEQSKVDRVLYRHAEISAKRARRGIWVRHRNI